MKVEDRNGALYFQRGRYANSFHLFFFCEEEDEVEEEADERSSSAAFEAADVGEKEEDDAEACGISLETAGSTVTR